MFQVDGDFVKSNLEGLTDEDRTLMDAFVGQSLHTTVGTGALLPAGDSEVDEPKGSVPAKKALFRISGYLPAPGDDSPLRDGVFRSKLSQQRGEFNFEGQMIATGGKRATKLTKIFKRRDNQGKLLNALGRMKLD